jgi:serine/threonine protein kinase
MTPERWQKIEEIFQAASDRDAHDRVSFLDEACAGDEELRTEAVEMLLAFDNAGSFLEEPAISQDAQVLFGATLDERIGQSVGRYRIIDRLGSGGMAEVYLAHDEQLERLVALKILPAYFVSDDRRLRRFQGEAKAASGLNHPNILTIYEVGKSDGAHFIATEYIDGLTIRELIAQNVLSLKEILDITEQVAAGLSAAHAAGIVHRDIKPENLMRRSDGIVKILDFGIAKLLEPDVAESEVASTRTETEAGVILGTVNYMSPEQARGFAVDEGTDIWSLGVVLYEMVAGQLPFGGATRVDTLVAILDREALPLRIPESGANRSFGLLKEIIERSLQKERADRYATVDQMTAELARVKQEFSVSGQEEDAAGRGLRAQRKELPADYMTDSFPTLSMASTGRRTGAGTAGQAKQSWKSWTVTIAVLVLLSSVTVGLFVYKVRQVKSDASAPASTGEGTTDRLYSQMSEAEQLRFIESQEQRISALMGDRPAKLNDDALRAIKLHVDRYVARTTTTSTEPGGEALQVIYSRPARYASLIAKTFAARKVPVVIGLYLPMIESEYRECYENSIGAKGLFQFLPRTARLYGVAHDEMCDVEKMTPAAAHYIADRMAELGDDSESMTLVLLSYNSGPESVREALRQLRDTENYQRNFWTLYSHRDRLDETFRNENAAYVPNFFAAAIIGENPAVFGLKTAPLSSLVTQMPSATP